MSDKVKFHNMTKPMKFRRSKLFKQRIVLWCGTLRERIIYLFNYILYKLHILNRYSYRDMVEKVVPFPHEFEEKSINSKYFGGTVKMQLIRREYVDLDYFYYKRKDGSSKRTLTVNDFTDINFEVVAYLKDIHINVANHWYNVDHLPTFKGFIEPELTAWEGDIKQDITLEVKTVDYDIKILKNLRLKYLLNPGQEDLSKPMVDHYYDLVKGEFGRLLSSMTLADIMI